MTNADLRMATIDEAAACLCTAMQAMLQVRACCGDIAAAAYDVPPLM